MIIDKIFEQIINDSELEVAKAEVSSAKRLLENAFDEAIKVLSNLEFYTKGLEDYQNSLPQDTIIKLKGSVSEGERAIFEAYLENFKLLDQMKGYCSSYAAKINAHQKRLEDGYKLIEESKGEQRTKAIDNLWALMQITPLNLTALQVEGITYLNSFQNKKSSSTKKGIK